MMQRRTLAIMGDGGFWHNGLASGIGNAVFNKADGVIVIVEKSTNQLFSCTKPLIFGLSARGPTSWAT